MKSITLSRLIVGALAVCFSLPSASAEAAEYEETAGQMQSMIGEKLIGFPLLKSDYNVDIAGDIATVTLKQTFLNPTESALNATYLFPLNQKAAIYAMEMKSGNEVIKAVIKRKAEAKATFESAKKEGKTAALLVQHRPNMFTQNMANLMPNSTINITLSYVQNIPKIDQAYELVIPMIVGPRYEGEKPTEEQPKLSDELAVHLDDADTKADTKADIKPDTKPETIKKSGWDIDKLPQYPSVIGLDTPQSIDPERVGLTLRLNSALSISSVNSSTHDLAITGDEFAKRMTFAQSKVIDNKDFVLRYALGDESAVQTGLLSHHDERGGFLSLMIEPPKVPVADSMTPREVVFVLDTSGSMSGEPMEASKTFMREALAGLRETDYFRILRFSDNTSGFSQQPMIATRQNVYAGTRFVSQLQASGGTEMDSAINAAFDLPQIANTLRIVVFLSDGYIGGDREVIRTINQRIGKARIYAFGIGDSVNRFLLDGMAKEGRGYARYVETGERAGEVAKGFAKSIESPLLTDISIDWNGLQVSDQTPVNIPDLFAGGSSRIFARYSNDSEEGDDQHEIFVSGLVNGNKATMPMTITLADSNSAQQSSSEDTVKQSPIPLIWARQQIFQKNRAYTLLNEEQTQLKNQLKEEIVQLGLGYSLQSRFTSFVAVSETVVNPNAAKNSNANVPLPKVSGTSPEAYPNLNLSGSSTPEPRGIIAFIMLAILAVVRFYQSAERKLTKTLVAETLAKMFAI